MFPGETIMSGAPAECEVCGKKYELQILQSNAGYYIGTWCCEGPNSRESLYFKTEKEAKIALCLLNEGYPVGMR